MIQWKQRLYAFLLRRILGPFLDSESYQKLHDSIDVSLQEGKFVLTDIGLNADYLTETSLQSKFPGLSIVKAKVDRLEISLTLKETSASTPAAQNDDDDGSTPTATTNSSFAWRAMKFGISSADVPAVALLAEIEIDGTTIELEASDHATTTRPQQTPHPTAPAKPSLEEETEPSPRSLIGSYIDAALASLQLTLKVTKTQVILRQKPNGTEEFQPWVSIGMSSISYQDVDISSNSSENKTIFKKVVDVSEITVQAGERKVGVGSVVTHPQSTVALAKGSGQVQLRVYESITDGMTSIQRDVEVNLNHQLHLSVDVLAIQQIKSVLHAVSQASSSIDDDDGSKELIKIGMTSLAGSPLDMDDSTDQEDIQALSVIMKQYREAYHLAEQKQLKGGVLIPTSAYRDDGDVMVEEDPEGDGSFDLFFDANDQSFYNAASVLAESRRIQEESVHDEGSESGDVVSTKVRFHLQRAGIKIVFRESTGRRSLAMCDEYVLLTMEDLHILYRESGISSESTVSIAHLVIEDAQLDRSKRSVGSVSIGGGPIVEGVLDIDTLVGFNSSDDEGEIDQVLFEAPCISVSVKKDINANADTPDSVVCEASFLPLEVCIRQRTLSNISSFANQIGDSTPAASNKQATTSEKKKQQMVFVQCSCPSITVGIPLSRGVPTAQLFHRHQTVLQNAPKKGTWLGFLLLNNSFVWNAFPKENHTDVMVETGTYMAHHMLMFVQSPVGDVVDVDAAIRRADIFVANGRVEVNPVTPITIEVKRNHDDAGRDSFPLVPSISSFKARQEDDDEDLKIDKLLFSKMGDVDADSRKELRGSDPQFGMASESEKASTVISISIPEVAIEATKSEMETVLQVLEALKPEDDPNAGTETARQDEPAVASSAPRTCLALNISKTTVVLKQDAGETIGKEDDFSFLVALDTFKIHALKQGSLTKHVRVLAHDPCLYEVHHEPSAFLERQSVDEDGFSRIEYFQRRLNLYSSSFAAPILFRSQMFSPMSRESPSILLDYIETTAEKSSRSRSSGGKRVHFTLYHLTHRFDVDSKWTKRLADVLPSRTSSKEESDSLTTTEAREEKREITKVYVSLSDVNFDYTPPDYFETPSRTILRLGDFRFSSNIITPSTKTQAYSISLGDISFHVLDQKYPHDRENRSLCRSNLVWRSASTTVLSPPTSVLPPTAETLLRELGFVKVVSLDAVDAVILTREKANEAAYEPRTLTSLTFGTLSMRACKDSFSCFATSMGELNAKLTALTDADIETLRQETESAEVTSENEPGTSDLAKSLVGPADAAGDAQQQKPRPDMLDGYDWATVDHDPLPELPIPDGYEQVARWYGSSTSQQRQASPIGNGTTPRIIQQHFPLHAVSDPLSDGDLGASKHAGDDANVDLKSRLIIHQLSVKLRFFDGYDWPSRMSAEQRKAAGRQGSSFVIETLPENERLALKEQQRKEAEAKQSTKAQLLSDLLGPPEETSSTFSSAPLPEEKAAAIEAIEKVRRFSRKPHLFFQLSANGVTLRVDSLENDPSHQLVSILALSVADLFIAETASGPSPIKMLGEWVNDSEHPHDTRYGTIMMKMVTWHPETRVTEENEVASDECEMTVQILPMRCILDQHAINFIKAFFHNEEKEGNDSENWNAGLHYLPPPLFRSVRVKPWKLKVDYLPQKLDVDALREGSFVELVNVSPIDGMVITLSLAKVENLVGFGPVGGGLVGKWVQEIVATQLHKFLANARPFEPFTNVGQGVGDLIVLPYEAFKNGEDIRRAMSSGIKSLAETFAFQTLTTTSRLTQYAANKMAGTVRGRRRVNVASNPLPSRPTHAPKGVGDVTGHAMESLARGIQAANYKVVIVPYREYVRNGPTGAATSVIKGVPVLLVAPLTGATEALSYTLLGARNALRPDIRKEEEAIRHGITGYDM
mmetsp:Transcript_22399/g.55399  ORF Transcript_22399/g.55399 Transcript_22399/m.55399 type:complete len:1910 (-) Transcript_22399:166-5895(-)|eukprot:CAMPEP_0113606626 /NCGR_PEP_ID=MMETSP0017_2-20120614/2957_1 /TAXON_ID=2856 /ORGANISM="Cylindrotheca closterium" /LENGTH=1909 /DNA_ID=CAMNT_0000515187 /DNA_START=30 /DNA_END=5759 /DNA_ORIENTATION=- /assembly_acc=CAM_ASM_000147